MANSRVPAATSSDASIGAGTSITTVHLHDQRKGAVHRVKHAPTVHVARGYENHLPFLRAGRPIICLADWQVEPATQRHFWKQALRALGAELGDSVASAIVLVAGDMASAGDELRGSKSDSAPDLDWLFECFPDGDVYCVYGNHDLPDAQHLAWRSACSGLPRLLPHGAALRLPLVQPSTAPATVSHAESDGRAGLGVEATNDLVGSGNEASGEEEAEPIHADGRAEEGPPSAHQGAGKEPLATAEQLAGLDKRERAALPTAPTVSERSLSESYGAGASQYEEAALAEWKARGQLAADAAKRKGWQAASAEFAACVELRPDWEKGHSCLARVQAKVAAAAQQQPEHQSRVVSAEAEAGAVAQATEEGAGAAGMVALEVESDGGSDAHSVAAVGVVPSFNVGRGVALEDTAADLTRVEAALRQLRPPARSALAGLTLSGALNPVHTGHVQMLEAAAAALTAAGRHHAVLFGFLAPSSEGYLQHKLGAEALALRERCELCSATVEDRPSLGVLDWGVASSHAVAQGTEALLAKAFPAFRFTTFQVVGADFARKASLVEKAAGGRAGQYVCVKRRGLARDDAEWLRALEARHACGKLPSGFVLAEAPPEGASSTRVRELCKAGQWNALAASGLLHPAVVDALSERRWLQD